MRIIRLLLITLCPLSQISHADSWFWQGNFDELPNYTEHREKHTSKGCAGDICVTGLFIKRKYFRAEKIDEDYNLKNIYGVWSGGDCQNDRWELREDGGFSAKYPVDGGVYSWSGEYKISRDIYVEDGRNNKEEKEYNEATLYYVPTIDKIVYKGIRSLDGIDSSGKEKFITYHGPEFYYFKRCKP